MKLVIKDNDTLVMALAIIAATMLVSTVIVEVLDLIDDAEAKKGEKTKSKKKGSGGDRPNR
jgi:hypothetical protein